MESSVSKYDILFRVKILHHHFLDVGKLTAGNLVFDIFDDLTGDKKKVQLQKYDIDSWLVISPDKSTAKLLKDRGLVFKQMNDGFAVFTSVINKKPAKNIDKTKFIFDLFFHNDGAFISALPLIRKNNQTVYYLFSNEVAAASGNTNQSLCQSPPNYDVTQKYSAGEIVADAGNHYLALNKIDNLNKAVADTNYWRQINDTIRFANTSNLLERPAIPNDSTVDEILKLADQQLPPLAFGRIEISENKSIPTGFRVLNTSNEVRQRLFDIRINRL
jgi:hypothetical protein